ncbi:hypothetical protein SEA_PATELGO_258 [Streptomyces phage Patelgo]|nr:hypothetical protein SEA_PATELGO_258 [Streptomyces phage Patelgo]
MSEMPASRASPRSVPISVGLSLNVLICTEMHQNVPDVRIDRIPAPTGVVRDSTINRLKTFRQGDDKGAGRLYQPM